MSRVKLSTQECFQTPNSNSRSSNAQTLLSYDDGGLLTETRLQSASGDVVTGYTYDADQRLTRLTLPDASWVGFEYDALNRMTARQYPSAPAENVAFTYDDTSLGNKGVGRLTGMTDQAGSTTYRYDDRGNRVSETRVITGQSFTTSYTYDSVGRVASVTYPSGRIVTYSRDSVGRIAGVTTKASSSAPVQTVASSVTWLPFGPLAGFTHGNGIATSFAHDTDYRLTRITASSGTPVQDIELQWDGASNIQSITDHVQPTNSQSFTYDALDRLTGAQGPYGSLSWTYDAVGNRLSEQKVAGTTTNLQLSNHLQPSSGGDGWRCRARLHLHSDRQCRGCLREPSRRSP